MCPAVQVISAELRSSKRWELTEEGTEIAEQGSHEARVFSSIPLEGLAQSELMVSAAGEQVDPGQVELSKRGKETSGNIQLDLGSGVNARDEYLLLK